MPINESSGLFIQQLYTLDKGLSWKDAELIAPKLRIRNIVKYKNVYYLASDSLGLFESINDGLTWKKNTTINAGNNVDVKELNGVLFCHHDKGLYYLKDSQWTNINTSELPSTIHQIGATPTSIFVTTFRDGIWKYPMADIVATEVASTNDASMKIYPNPTDNYFTINLNKDNETLQIYSIEGMLLQESELGNGEQRVSTSQFPNGMYLIKLKGKSTNSKLVISR